MGNAGGDTEAIKKGTPTDGVGTLFPRFVLKNPRSLALIADGVGTFTDSPWQPL